MTSSRGPALVDRIVRALRDAPGPRSTADLAREFLGTGLLDEAQADAVLAPSLAADARLARSSRGWTLRDGARLFSADDPPLASGYVAAFAPWHPTGASSARGGAGSREPSYTVCAGGSAEAERFELRSGDRLPRPVIDLARVLRRWRGWRGRSDPLTLAAAAGGRHVAAEGLAGSVSALIAAWDTLAAELTYEGIERCSQLECLLEERLELARFEGKRFGPAELAALPESPGVYAFLDASRRAIYVGQSCRLSVRVASYFSGMPRDEKDREIRSGAVELATREVESAPDAAIEEARWIARLEPRLNTKLATRSEDVAEGILLARRHRPGAGWIAFTLARGTLAHRGSLRAGPRRSLRAARRAVTALVAPPAGLGAHAGRSAAATLVDRWRRAHADAPFLELAIDGGPEDLVARLVELAHEPADGSS